VHTLRPSIPQLGSSGDAPFSALEYSRQRRQLTALGFFFAIVGTSGRRFLERRDMKWTLASQGGRSNECHVQYGLFSEPLQRSQRSLWERTCS
jgi:hypothetical protein